LATELAARPHSGPAEGWRLVRFGEVVRQTKVDADPETSGLERYVAGEHMDTDDLHIRRWGTIGDGYLGPAFHRRFKSGQMLYGSRRTYLRKVAVASFEGITANTTFVLESAGDDLLPELLPFVMQTDAFNEHSVRQSRGSVNPYVNFRDIADYTFPLPPRVEQRRIADILWAADAAVEHWREAESNVIKMLKAIVSSWLGDEAFPKAKVGSVARFRSGDSFPVSGLGPRTDESPIPVHGGNGISGFASEGMAAIEDRVVVIGRVGQFCGSVWLADPPCRITDNALYSSELKPDFDVEFLSLCLENLQLNRSKLGTYLPLVTQTLVHGMEIPKPDLEHQRKLVAQHRELAAAELAAARALEVNVRLAEALREGLLLQGFEDRVV
jgi:type I restriction enzyme, S subunit